MSDIDNKTYTPNSSTIHNFSYNLAKKELVVQFKGGEVYTYAAVPQEIYEAMNDTALEESFGKNDASTGKFFHANIRKGGYEFKKSE